MFQYFCLLALGATAGMFTFQSVPEWYATLNRPSLNPLTGYLKLFGQLYKYLWVFIYS